MTLKNEREAENTRQKLRVLEDTYDELETQTENDELREASRESLKRLINQFKEEIARFEARHPVRR
ncbi:MAG: hypothetical protein IT450_19375 [Phycisphaerales bacterium]|nr:hypothetical protein [Phycisphaerales bacterium]